MTGKDRQTGSGLEMREARFPGRAPIDAYGDGGFRFAGMSHRGSLLCLPSGVYAWNTEEPDDLKVSAFARIVEEAATIEVLLVGTGTELRRLPDKLRAQLSSLGIVADPMSTGAAVRTYNVLLSEGRAVAAALLAV